ncbi:hypothetical protein BD410DRAFT_136396 [Rickenella mellea]|uniref:PB1 domain-containing protein n=1 Tax=Rickenella mellea TaxID=50990 RepID=A0A4Y7PL56_9AGAM|nr:hypothetical protein BD410DRAFT_136396 [Rickenella mellea]
MQVTMTTYDRFPFFFHPNQCCIVMDTDCEFYYRYFQCGVSNFLLGRYELSLRDFDEAFLYLRGNQAINYEQLGLKFKLFSAEVLFNKGLSQIYLGNINEGLQDMQEAQREKATEEHNVIDDAIADRGEGYTVFSIPVGVLYRPSENKLKNSKAKDYLGKAVLVAASDAQDAYTTFTGSTRLQQGMTPVGAPLDRPASDPTPSLSRSATVPPPRAPVSDLGDLKPVRATLDRSKSTATQSDRGARSEGGAPMARSNTMLNRPGMPAGPTRGLSVRRPSAGGAGGGATSPTRGPDPPSPPAKGPAPGPRLTEIYDNYIGGYEDEAPPLPTAPPSQRVAAWARTNANPANTPSRAPSTRAPSAYGSSSGSVRRRLTRKGTVSRSRTVSGYDEEEEEGYVSGEYEDGPFELVKIRVKLHYDDDIRGMTLTPETPFEEFYDRVCQKFGREGISMKFQDEDGGKISLRDESDYELAIETARELSKGKPEGKLEIWCQDK